MNIINTKVTNEYDYDYLDNFIAKNKNCNDLFGSITSRDLIYGKKIYNEMKKTIFKNPSYKIFGGNGWGTSCYALYKSKEEIIYLIRCNYQTPTDYLKINEEDENIFDL